MSGSRRMAVTDAIAGELASLKQRFGITAPQLIQVSVQMLRRYVEAIKDGHELKMVDRHSPLVGAVSVEMPIQILNRNRSEDVDVTENVWEAYKQHPNDQLLRNQLIERYSQLVKNHADRLSLKLPQKVDVDDLYSAGVFGLMDAIDGYDPDKGAKFETYCALRIRGSMIDWIRQMDWVPRSVRSRASKLAAARQEVELQRGRPAIDTILADHMQLGEEEYRKFKVGASVAVQMSLHKEVFNGDGKNTVMSEVLEDLEAADPTEYSRKRDLLRLVTLGMTQQERLLIVLYYYEGLTMRQVGKSLGVSESRVSQMHTELLKRLRDRLADRRSEFI